MISHHQNVSSLDLFNRDIFERRACTNYLLTNCFIDSGYRSLSTTALRHKSMASSRQLLASSTLVIAILAFLLRILVPTVFNIDTMPPVRADIFSISTFLRRLPHASISPYLPATCSHRSTNPTIPQPARWFSNSLAKMSSSKSFADAVQERRSYYQLNKESPISDKQLEKIVKDAVLYTPSSFNSQSSRVVVLLHGEHDKFWEITKEVLKPNVPDKDAFAATVKKLDGFKAGYGTVC